TWYEGARDGKRHLPSPELFQGEVPSDSGSLLVGEKGSIFSPSDYGAEQMLMPADRFEGKHPKVSAEQRKQRAGQSDPAHKAEWVRAIKENDPRIAWSNFDYAGRFTEAMLLGNVSVRLGVPLEFDPDSGRVTNYPEAARYMQPEYRSGW